MRPLGKFLGGFEHAFFGQHRIFRVRFIVGWHIGAGDFKMELPVVNG
jgi:hypothetical protein